MSQLQGKKFYSQLEGLRGVAVFLVLVSHFVLIKKFPQYNFLFFGFIGVNLFFVLSGFLITEILLRDIEKKKRPGEILKSFYIKRTLRIFPIYYLSILIIALFNVNGGRDNASWAFFYALNIKDIWFGSVNEIMTHLWSLCVEEQFYLIWPLMIILISAFIRKYFIVAVILVSILLRSTTSFFHTTNSETFNHSSMFTCMDALGTGALIAYLKTYSPEKLQTILRRIWIPVLVTILFFLLNYLISHHTIFIQTFNRSMVALLGFFLVGWGALNIQTWWAKVANNRVVRYLGKISYGIYLYHWFLYVIFEKSFSLWFKGLMKGRSDLLYYNAWAVSFVFFTLFTIAVATVSYYSIEQPLLKVKNRVH